MSAHDQIHDVKAFPTSFPLPASASVKLGIGRAVKRDAVVVKVTTNKGLVGYGESHHGRAPGTVAHLVNTTLRQLVVGMDAFDTTGVWERVYTMQLQSHGMGAGAAIAMSGIDMALWDIRGKAAGWPLYKLLGGTVHPIPAYAGGVSVGYLEPEQLVEEVRALTEQGYAAVKLPVGDTPQRDQERVRAVRKAFGPTLAVLTDANTGYTLEDVRQAMPQLDELAVGWLEEPFAAHDYCSHATAATFGQLPLAAGENHYTRFEFVRLIEDGSIRILQPDLSKTGGVTEALRLAALASAWRLPIRFRHTTVPKSWHLLRFYIRTRFPILKSCQHAISFNLLKQNRNLSGYFTRLNPLHFFHKKAPHYTSINSCKALTFRHYKSLVISS